MLPGQFGAGGTRPILGRRGQNMTLQHRFWADYTARDFARLDKGAMVAVFPVAAIQQHGPRLPLSVDTAIANGLMAACLPLIPADCPAIFLPTISVGKSDQHIAWPGTLTHSAQTLIAMWTEIGDSVAAAGKSRWRRIGLLCTRIWFGWNMAAILCRALRNWCGTTGIWGWATRANLVGRCRI